MPSAAIAAELGDRELSAGMDGGDVAELQSILTKLGFEVSSDGHFGPETEQRLREYEQAKTLPVDGKLGRCEAAEIKLAANGSA